MPKLNLAEAGEKAAFMAISCQRWGRKIASALSKGFPSKAKFSPKEFASNIFVAIKLRETINLFLINMVLFCNFGETMMVREFSKLTFVFVAMTALLARAVIECPSRPLPCFRY